MKYLLLQNHTTQCLYFAYCTISACACEVCNEWTANEANVFTDETEWTYGWIKVAPSGKRIDRFCSKWDCIGACYFCDELPTVAKNDMFDYDEGMTYTIDNGKADVNFCHKKHILAEKLVDACYEIGWNVGEQLSSELCIIS